LVKVPPVAVSMEYTNLVPDLARIEVSWIPETLATLVKILVAAPLLVDGAVTYSVAETDSL
jgi:hypothetical protein